MKSARLFSRDFTLMVIGQIISLLGNAVLRFALPLQVLDATGSAAAFGGVLALSMVPVLLCSPLGGVLADRVPRQAVMWGLDFATAGLTLGYALLFPGGGPLGAVGAMMVLLAAIQALYQPAVQASVPLLVQKEKLIAGNAVINQVNTLSGLLGPVAGGVLFTLWGIGPILLLSAACFAFSAVMEIFIRIPHERRPSEAGVFQVVRQDLQECCRFVQSEKPVFVSVVVLVAMFNLVLSAVMIVGTPILITQVLGMSDTLYGLTQGSLALGGLCGGALAAACGDKLRVQKAHLLLLACSAAVAVMGLSLWLHLPSLVSYAAITLMSFAAMGASTLFMVQIYTLVQVQTPPQLVGKVMAALISIAMCGQPVGQALYGLLFGLFAPYPYLVLLGAAGAALCISLCSRRVFGRLA